VVLVSRSLLHCSSRVSGVPDIPAATNPGIPAKPDPVVVHGHDCLGVVSADLWTRRHHCSPGMLLHRDRCVCRGSLGTVGAQPAARAAVHGSACSLHTCALRAPTIAGTGGGSDLLWAAEYCIDFGLCIGRRDICRCALEVVSRASSLRVTTNQMFRSK